MNRRPSGEEYRDVLAEVLEDQAERQKQWTAREAPPKDHSALARKALLPLVLVLVWVVVAPPAFLLPPPPPAPTTQDLSDGLHMDIFVVAAQVLSFQRDTGRLPESLDMVLTEPETAQGLAYRVLPGGTFEISGQRGGQTVAYTSTESLREFVAEARSAVQRGSTR